MPGLAGAQALTNPIPVLPSDYPNERTGVADRWRPDYEAQGLPLGSLEVHPRLGVGVDYTSNVFGADTDEVNDFWLGINPAISIDSGQGADGLASFEVKANAALRRFADQKLANETGLGASAAGTVPLGANSYVMGGAAARRLYERQESGSFPTGSIAPIRYSEITSFVRMRTGGSRIRGTIVVDMSRTEFNNAKLSTGSSFDQGFRDRTVLRGSGRIETSFTGAASGFVEARYSNVDYIRNFVTPGVDNRDGRQAEILTGVRVDSGKLRGSLAGGYTRRTFKSAAYNDFGGFALNGEVIYYASGLSTFTLTGFRNIGESGDPNISAQFTTGVAARVDHELLRYIILSGSVGYDRNTYRNFNRKDEVATVKGSVRYLVSRNLELDATAGYVKRTTSIAAFGPEFDRFEFGLNLIGKF